MTGSSRDQRYRAFTLVEILVALGIVLILIAVLIPALVKARESANSAVCLSNIRALSIDYTDYTSTMTHMSNGWLYDYGLWLVELAPIIGNPGSTNIDDNTGVSNSYITPSIQKLAICPSTSLPPGFSAGTTLTTNLQTTNANFTVGQNANNTPANNAINPAIANGAISIPNAFTSWAVGDSTINGFGGANGGMVTNNWFFGSYGFNDWLYNGYNASNANFQYNIGGDIVKIPGNQLGLAINSNTNTTQLLTNAQTNNPNIQNTYQLVWNVSGQSPTPSTPLFFDSAWMETVPTYLDAPADPMTGKTPSTPPPNPGDTLTKYGFQDITSQVPTAATPNETMYYSCISRHGLSINVGFADGHGENVSLGNLWTLQWSATPPTPTGTAQSISAP
ncbi:MAG TPA: type II secretion system protein [Phycisphaerae bacterium]|nr:type II secretion system protein [Phycisphaerae bacterium]